MFTGKRKVQMSDISDLFHVCCDESHKSSLEKLTRLKLLLKRDQENVFHEKRQYDIIQREKSSIDWDISVKSFAKNCLSLQFRFRKFREVLGNAGIILIGMALFFSISLCIFIDLIAASFGGIIGFIAILAILYCPIEDETLQIKIDSKKQSIIKFQTKLERISSQYEPALLRFNEAQESLFRTTIEVKAIENDISIRQERELKRLSEIPWRNLRGVDFEEFLGEVFSRLGYEVELTKASGDQGADLILKKDSLSICVQVKGWTGNVTNKAVQEAIAGKEYYNCDYSAVVANSLFTKSAIDLAVKTGCAVISGEHLGKIIAGKVNFLHACQGFEQVKERFRNV
jgi:Restriction endonuclease